MKNSPIPAIWEVPQTLRDRLGTQVGRQRAMEAEGHLLLVLHQPPKPDETLRTGCFFWRKPDGTWSSSEFGTGASGLERHLDSYAALIEQFDRREETAKSPADYFHLLECLAPLHRAIRNMYATLQDARQMVRTDRGIIDARDRAYVLERTADLLTIDVKNALDYLVARKVEEQSDASQTMAIASHRLNVLAAFFFPLATLSAIFGMDLPHGLEDLPRPWPFLAVLAVGLICGFVLKSFVGAPLGRTTDRTAEP